jgi:hypothetical protein
MHCPQGGDDDDVVDAHFGKSHSSCFHPKSPRLETTREVKGLFDDASNKGTEVNAML